MTIPILKYRPTADGLARWLHPLELAIMVALWEAGRPRTVKQIWIVLQRDYRADIAYTTALRTACRLVEKNLLTRTPTGANGAHVYATRCTEAEFIEIQVRAILQSLEEHVYV